MKFLQIFRFPIQFLWGREMLFGDGNMMVGMRDERWRCRKILNSLFPTAAERELFFWQSIATFTAHSTLCCCWCKCSQSAFGDFKATAQIQVKMENVLSTRRRKLVKCCCAEKLAESAGSRFHRTDDESSLLSHFRCSRWAEGGKVSFCVWKVAKCRARESVAVCVEKHYYVSAH